MATLETPHAIRFRGRRWPVVAGIPFARAGREPLADAALAALDAGDEREALALLLRDRDDWDRTVPPSLDETRALVRDEPAMTLRDAMAALRFGDVATYFAHRWSDPTFVAGLGLLAAHRPRGGPRSFELACGIGHHLRELARVGVDAHGGDVVFAKLWLARRFVAPDARLACFDAAEPWPVASAAYDLVHVHDALYFLPAKPHVARELRRVGTADATIAVSHAHNAAVDNLSSGAPLDRAGYAALFPDAAWYDDAALAAAAVADAIPAANAPGIDGAAAFAFATGPTARAPQAAGGDVALPAAGTPLRRNPLYAASDGARADARIAWPSARYEREYAALATYPAASDAPERTAMSDDPATVARARRRELVALPERW